MQCYASIIPQLKKKNYKKKKKKTVSPPGRGDTGRLQHYHLLVTKFRGRPVTHFWSGRCQKRSATELLRNVPLLLRKHRMRGLLAAPSYCHVWGRCSELLLSFSSHKENQLQKAAFAGRDWSGEMDGLRVLKLVIFSSGNKQLQCVSGLRQHTFISLCPRRAVGLWALVPHKCLLLPDPG